MRCPSWSSAFLIVMNLQIGSLLTLEIFVSPFGVTVHSGGQDDIVGAKPFDFEIHGVV